MDWNLIETNWLQMGGHLKTRWNRLTDDQLTGINGERDKLAWKIQEIYGTTRENAEMQIKEFEQRAKSFLA